MLYAMIGRPKFARSDDLLRSKPDSSPARQITYMYTSKAGLLRTYKEYLVLFKISLKCYNTSILASNSWLFGRVPHCSAPGAGEQPHRQSM